jgi:hypothetical protein
LLNAKSYYKLMVQLTNGGKVLSKKVTRKEVFRVAIKLTDKKAMGALIEACPIDIGNIIRRQKTKDGFIIEVLMHQDHIDKLKKAGFDFEVIESATKVGEQRQKEVIKGDPFEGGKIAPRGLGVKERKQ